MVTKRLLLNSIAGASAAILSTYPFTSFAFEDRPNADYPSHPVRWVVPYTPGGATDVISRLICERLSQRLGQDFVVENKPGAGSNVGTQAVINSPADGYTILLISTANAINVSFDKTLPFDFSKEIVPVVGLARIPLVLVVNNDLPIHTIPEFIAFAKANPNSLSIASSGTGTSLHLSGVLFKAITGINFEHVPYRGSAPGLTDVMSGQIQGMFDNVTSSLELIRAGKLRALGVTTRERSDVLPDVPSISESLPGYETSSFYGVGVPRETSPRIVALLNTQVNAALNDPAIKRRLSELGAIPLTGNVDQFAVMLTNEIDRWRKVVEYSSK
jgi:tripartite-type tricarboxylate transporter receptor subunit TctC